MLAWIAAAAALIEAVTGQTGGCAPIDMRAAGVPYRGCLAHAAAKLERSGETASDVATAAMAECRGEAESVRSYLAGCRGYANARSIMLKLNAGLHDDLVETVVTARARKRTGQ